MLKSKLVLSIILIVACLAQLFSCVFQGNFQNAFMIGLAPSDYGFEITKFLLLLLPLCFILFFTSGSIENGKINMAVSPETVFTDKITLLVLGAYKELQKCFRI